MISTRRSHWLASRLAGAANGAADRKDMAGMAEARAELLAAGALLGLLTRTPAEWEQGSDSDENARIDAMVAARAQARADMNWAEATVFAMNSRQRVLRLWMARPEPLGAGFRALP